MGGGAAKPLPLPDFGYPDGPSSDDHHAVIG
jgi:hypothetical protein